MSEHAAARSILRILQSDPSSSDELENMVIVASATERLVLSDSTISHTRNGAAIIQCEQAVRHQHTSLICVESMDALLNIRNFLFPSIVGERPLFIYRGSLQHTPAAVLRVIEAQPDGVIAFNHYDPPSVRVSLGELPNVKGAIFPSRSTCANLAAKVPGTITDRVRAWASAQWLERYRNFEPVGRLLDHHYHISQPQMQGCMLEYHHRHEWEIAAEQHIETE